MPPTCQRDRTNIDWNEATRLIETGFPVTLTADVVRAKFPGSQAASFVVDGPKLVGAGRAISDGVTSSAIYDVVVLPEYQGRGVGRLIRDDLLAQLPKNSVMLVSVPGKEGFYRKHGFLRLTTALMRKADPASWVAGGSLES